MRELKEFLTSNKSVGISYIVPSIVTINRILQLLLSKALVLDVPEEPPQFFKSTS